MSSNGSFSNGNPNSSSFSYGGYGVGGSYTSGGGGYGGQGGGYVGSSYGGNTESSASHVTAVSSSSDGNAVLRRRHLEDYYSYSNGNNDATGDGGISSSSDSRHRITLGSSAHSSSSSSSRHLRSPRQVIKKLDFMFPKVEQEYTIRTDSGGVAFMVAMGLLSLFLASEVLHWRYSNAQTIEHIRVDTSLGQRMQVNLNITFPSLACEDLHVDVMDVAGDSQFNVEESMSKRRLNMRGVPMGTAQIVESNQKQQEEEKKKNILKAELPEDYCGPCYGASDLNSNVTCCNTCDELIAAYTMKRWRTDVITMTSEQCIRDGRDKASPKLMQKGEGCNLAGSMTLNRVAGNFHIAMGEGVERDGRHIHLFVPEDTPNFNASHIIHHLSFGAPEEENAESYLDGATKIVTEELGTTGLFQYFIKVVPTTYVSKQGKSVTKKETNRYFVTERFRPLMREYVMDDDGNYAGDDDASSQERMLNEVGKLKLTKDEDGKALVDAHFKGSHHDKKHHDVKNAILPGVFFIYEIYPFSVEVTPNSVPVTHLIIRIMAIIGGVFTIVRWADSFLFKLLANGSKR